MCRLLAYVGEPLTLDRLLYEPPHSLEEQAWCPRMQEYGTMNADGWGVGWYDLTRRAEPARYRTDRPMWTDRSFPSIAPLLESTCVLAAVRSATPPAPTEESGAPPFTSGRVLFAHNGAVPGWKQGLGERLRRQASVARAGAIEGSSDSETVFALVLDALDTGASLGNALVSAIGLVTAEAPDARCNLVLTDGIRLAATAWGDTLFVRGRGERTELGVFVASEPFDDDAHWDRVPDRTLVTVDETRALTLTPIDR